MHSFLSTIIKFENIFSYPVHYICPTFHSYTLKHCNHGIQYIIKCSDTMVGTGPASTTFRYICLAIVAFIFMSGAGRFSFTKVKL